MKIRSAVVALSLVVGTFAVTRAVYSQEKPAEAPAAPSPEEIEKVLAERAAMAEEHKRLAELAGTWDADCRMWMAPGEPVRSKGTMESRLELGGRVLVSTYKGEFAGKPFEGIDVRGYDKEKRQHWTIWCDSMGTGHMRSVGARDKDGNIALESEPMEWMGQQYKSRVVVKTIDKDTFVMESFGSVVGTPGEMKEMEIRYTRRK